MPFGEFTMIDTDLIRRQLTERLAQLTAKLTEIDEDLKEHGNEADFEEHATEIAGDEVLEGLGIQGQKEALQIKAALKRLDEGSYGICVQCGEVIPVKRLQLLPATPLCVSCMAAS